MGRESFGGRNASSMPKPLYDIGEIPPLGHVPEFMHAWTIRRERHGTPSKAMQDEVIPIWEIGAQDVLVLVMAAGINYNGVWAAAGKPASVFDIHRHSLHIAGSDAAGIVWATGSAVRHWKVGDEVVLHCNRVDGEDEECNGGDPMLSPSQRIWGYETPDGSFAQFTRVHQSQVLPRPQHLSWAQSACYMLTLATSYRMLLGHHPHTLHAGQNVLVWGASGGIGVFAIQLCKLMGANAIAVVSNASRGEFVQRLGAKAAIDRSAFNCWGPLPDTDSVEFASWLQEAKRFGKAIWQGTGAGVNVDIVVEHPGQMTFPVSCFVAKRGGMIVFCGGTTGYNLSFDARYAWMHQKRIQGSHFAHMKQAAEANRLIIDGRIDPCLADTFAWNDLPLAHERMQRNEHSPGNMAVLVGARAADQGCKIGAGAITRNSPTRESE